MDLHQNDSETTESIKEAKAICTCSTQEAKTLCSTTIKEAKATCTHSIQEAKTLCAMAIRDMETQGASQADSLHWSHAKSIQHLEEQAIEEESKSQLDFLSTFQAALWASPMELHGMLVASYHVLMGQALMSTHLAFHKKLPPLSKCLPPWLLPLLHLSIHLDPSHGIPLQTQWTSCLPVGPCPRATPEGPPSSKQQEIMPLHKVLTQSHLETFSQDSSLVREMREE